MAKRFSFFALLLIVLFSACESAEHYKLASSGVSGEVILVMEDRDWKSNLGEVVRSYLEKPQDGLPQPEYQFNLGQYSHKNFSNVIRYHRNIILFEQNEEWITPQIEFLQNVYATNQVVIKLMASNPEDLAALFKDESERIISLINRRERERLNDRHLAHAQRSVMDSLRIKHHINLTIPEDCMLAEDRGDFIWIKRDRIRYVGGEAHDVDQGILVYTYPYVDDSTFTLDYLLDKRDSVLRVNVPGPSEGSYMATERDSMFFPVKRELELNDKFMFEIRGMYRTENDYYGGPFISLTQFDEKRGRIVTVDCYVFAPKFHKREYLREMEAVCYSLSFPD